ncbi:hypothetical protein QYE76_014067 [Lolium multiflorum]|uniref:Probable zinc-ribbon domain-containing protein n=1 Tax=Lolium multiflorum TaxID=4521 RepID=A0AAD8X6G5_LOLMU|nr:hypothetical protein QYE76_014067 [Lolium multiflorum]
MQAGGTKTRFGRCPYCRAIICQNTDAAVYYCSKCRTPIRGKNTEPTEDEAERALSRLEILSAVDTSSVYSDEGPDASCTPASVIDVDGDQPPPLSCGYNSNSDANSQGIAASSPSPYRGFSSPRDGTSRSNGCSPRGVSDNHVGSNDRLDAARSAKNRVTELRVSSRRTRRDSSASDPSILRRRDFSAPDQEEAPRNSGEQQLRRSALSTREMGTSTSMSGLEPSAAKASPLTDPAFNRDLLHALDKLRGMIVAIQLQPPQASGSGRGAMTRRESRLFRRMESQLAPYAEAHEPRRMVRNQASTGSASWSSASSCSGHGARSRKRHCFPVHGAAPFMVCGGCSELLQAPNSMTASRRGVTKLRCGGCGEVLELRSAGIAPHARRASRASGSGSRHGSKELERTASSSGGEQEVPPLLLYRALGFDSMSPLLHSQRY